MRGWVFKLGTSPAMHKAIHDALGASQQEKREREADALEALQKCVQECIHLLPENNASAFEELRGLLDGEADLIRTNDSLINEMGFASGGELLEDRLNIFYDLCDRYRIWITQDRPGIGKTQ